MTHHKNDQEWTHWLLNDQNRRFERMQRKLEISTRMLGEYDVREQLFQSENGLGFSL